MAEYHGYSPVDFYDTNPRFGSLEDYRKLVADIHRLGMKMIQDQILGYTGPRHHWVKVTAVSRSGSTDRWIARLRVTSALMRWRILTPTRPTAAA